MLILVGLGLGDPSDITLKGLEAVRNASRVYLEAYTSVICSSKTEDLEKVYGRKIEVADREFVESDDSPLLRSAEQEDICLLVVGDPLGATTHCDLLLRAKKQAIAFRVVHNASILTAVGCCGLQLYQFGETVSICFWSDTFQPESYYEKIAANRRRSLHTLCLLDIKVKERSIENVIKDRKIYEPPRFMSCSEAAAQLLEIVARKKTRRASSTSSDEESEKDDGFPFAYDDSTLCVGLARVGATDQCIIACSLAQMAADTSSELLGAPPLHSLIVVGTDMERLHPIEAEMLALWRPAVCPQ